MGMKLEKNRQIELAKIDLWPSDGQSFLYEIIIITIFHGTAPCVARLENDNCFNSNRNCERVNIFKICTIMKAHCHKANFCAIIHNPFLLGVDI